MSQRNKIITERMNCPNQLKCCKLSVKKLFKTRKMGVELFFECVGEDPQQCGNSIVLGESYFCDCPFRWYIKNKLEK